MFNILKRVIINWCLSKNTKTIGDIYNESNPDQVAIPNHNGDLKFIGRGASNILVETPKGWSPIAKTLKTIKYNIWRLQLSNGMFLEGADEHLVITTLGEKHLKSLSVGDSVLTSSGSSRVVSITETDVSENMYDLELDDEDHVYFTNGILSHNTTVVAMYILWFSLFNKDKNCVIASKAMNHATDIMSRIKFAYEELPEWLKAGCKFYNRTSIEFDNGSKIKCEATSEKTGRGGSPSILFIDEIAFISRRIQEEMWSSITPSLSTGGKFILTSTPNGDSDLFATIWKGANSKINSFKPIQVMWHQHPERGPDYYQEMLGKLGELKTRQEIDCEFLSSDALLIDSRKLHTLRSKKPIREDMGFKFWKELTGNVTYLVGVDPATGNGQDFTAIQVFEFPSLEQVAELRLNDVNIPLIFSKIKWLLRELRKPRNGPRAEVIWSFERNGVGEALVAMIQNDDSRDGGVYLDGVELYSDSPAKLGCFTSGKSKLLSCMQIKSLVEKVNNGFIINSEELLFELKHFVARGGSFSAKSGSTDDLVSALLVIGRLLQRLASYDDKARTLVYETVDPNSDSTLGADPEPTDPFMDEPIPFGFM